jgi:hypothetical protein
MNPDRSVATNRGPFLILLIAVTVSVAGGTRLSGVPVPTDCEGWWKYVYSPKRLVIQQPCVTVRGTVIKTKHVSDGDVIVIVALDPEYAHFSNEGNHRNYGKDTLELELVCRAPMFKFFVWRCWTCNNTLLIPRVGDHIEADGVYVLDTNHRHMEIHPVTRLTVLQDKAGKHS